MVVLHSPLPGVLWSGRVGKGSGNGFNTSVKDLTLPILLQTFSVEEVTVGSRFYYEDFVVVMAPQLYGQCVWFSVQM